MAETAQKRQLGNFGGFGGAIATMRVVAYRNYTISNVTSLTGTWLQKLAMSWLVWEQTQSPSWLGTLIFADLITVITVSPIIGAVADRIDRLQLMTLAQVIMMSRAIAMAVFFSMGWTNIWILLAMQVW